MKRTILLSISLSLCLLLGSTFAQSRKDVRQYYYWVNQAELSICDDNLLVADSLYTTAFSIKKPLAREMRTAYWVAVQTENNEIILQIAKCRIELGDEGLANSYQYMSPHFDTVVYQQLLDIEAQTIKTYCVKFDTILEHIIERDQRYRIQGMGVRQNSLHWMMRTVNSSSNFTMNILTSTNIWQDFTIWECWVLYCSMPCRRTTMTCNHCFARK